MEQLPQRTIDAIEDFLRKAYATDSLETFADHVARALPAVIDSDVTTFNEVHPARGRIAWVDEPAGSCEFPDSIAIFEYHIRDHPLIRHYTQTSDGRATKISDFLTDRQFRGLGLYTEFYRRLGIAHQMAVTLPAPAPVMLGIALNRRRHDFSERDRLALDVLRPRLAHAYETVAMTSRLRRDLDLFACGLRELGCEAFVVDKDGSIGLGTAGAAALLRRYYADLAGDPHALTTLLRRWIRPHMRQTDASAGFRHPVGPAVIERVIERRGAHLTVRVIIEHEEAIVLLDECRTSIDRAAVERYGLTSREIEVLDLVACGNTNHEIAARLEISWRTVRKHVEHIFVKLMAVETRAAAAAKALGTHSR